MEEIALPNLRGAPGVVPAGTIRWRAEFIAAAAAAVCYLNILPNDFSFDDHKIVRASKTVNESGQWLAIWTTDYWSELRDASPNRDLLYRPVTVTSFRLVRAIAGSFPLAHHIVNLLLHAVISAMVARLCRRLGGSEAGAAAAGLLFAVLPIHTEAVAAVVGRADLLATLGVLLAVLCHRRWTLARNPRRGAPWVVLAGLTAMAAMGAKESGICVAAMVVLVDAFWLGRSRGLGNHPRWLSTATLRRVAYLLIPVMVYLVLRYEALGGRLHQKPALTKTVNVLVDAPLWQHALGVIQLWGMYWAKTIWPQILSVGYSINAIRLATSPFDGHVLVGVLAAAGLVTVSVIAWRRGDRSIALVCAALAITYAPTANALVLIQVFFAERIWYLPSVWIALLFGLGIARLARRPVWYVIAALIVTGMTARCWVRLGEWRADRTLLAAAYRDLPDAVGALHLYGQWLTNDGQYEAGTALLERALEIDLGLTDAHRDLGAAHLRANNYEAALRHWQIANMQVPNHPRTVEALAFLRPMLSGKRRAELIERRRLAADDPQNVDAEIALVRKLRELAYADEALQRLRQREGAFSSHAAWQLEYAVTLVYLDRRDDAIARYRRGVGLDARTPQPMIELAMLLFERREGDDLDEAQALADRASKLAPGAPSVLICQAELLALRGDLAGAVRLYQDAIRALPPDSAQRPLLEQRARALGQ